MGRLTLARIEKHFGELTDPRRREMPCRLINIVTMALCAAMRGADDFVSIAHWAGMEEKAAGHVSRSVSGHSLA